MKYLLSLIVAFTVIIPSFAYAQTTTVERVIDGQVPIQAEFSNKIVYTDDAGADTSILKNDCFNRGGVFNECGSVCDESRIGEDCIAVCAFTCEFKNNSESIYTVERVIDGDTLKLTNGEEIRLIGIDAPAVFEEGIDLTLYDPSEEERQSLQKWGVNIGMLSNMGQKAKEGLEHFLLEWDGERRLIKLKFDVEKKDKYGRLFAYVYVVVPLNSLWWSKPSIKDERICVKINSQGWECLLNAELIKQGYAKPMTISFNVKYANLFKELYEEARENKRGLWKNGSDNFDVPRGNMNFNVVLTETGTSLISVIKEVRAITNLGLKDAKDLVDFVPSVIKEGLSKKEAEALKNKLEGIGAKVEIRGE